MKNKRIAGILLAGVMLFTALPVQAADIDTAYTGYTGEAAVVAADYAKVGSELEPTGTLPRAYSSREQGYVTPPRYQKYNTCWAYSSTAVLETLMMKNGKAPWQLSTMHMNYWGCKTEQDTGWQRSYSDAGYPYISLGYLTSFGAVTDDYFPDSKTPEDFAAGRSTDYPYAGATSVIYLAAADRDTVKTAVYEYGAAVGNFHYNGTCMNSSLPKTTWNMIPAFSCGPVKTGCWETTRRSRCC